jgi:hypothetical protein
MQPLEALSMLGTSRVIWIDDHFAPRDAEKLGELLARELEVTRKCDFANFRDLLDRIDEGDETATFELKQRLAEMTSEERNEIERVFSEKQSEGDNFATNDLNLQQITAVCGQLGIKADDCWAFDAAEARVRALCESDDSHVSYIVDLHDEFGEQGNTRGLDILRTLHESNSKGTAFLLTHEASSTTESTKESELRAILARESEGLKSKPICVIAKERLEGAGENVIADGLKVAIKRAGLRRGIHEVLIRAESELTNAFDAAMNSLLSIPPEQLNEYVVNRAVAEGVSELHVVERALTATISESIRKMFATDEGTHQSAARLRALQAVSLPIPASPHSELEAFRKKELWEPDDLVNRGHAALACGDVFEFASDEGVTDTRRFILLVQPCDVMVRSNGTRDADAGFLIPLKIKGADTGDGGSLKQPSLPFSLDNKEWICDFRSATSVRLATLDLGTLRPDGKVRFDKGQLLPTTLLPGQAKSGKKLFSKMEEAIKSRQAERNQEKHLFDARCTLTLASAGPFKEIAQATFFGEKQKPVPKRSERSARNNGPDVSSAVVETLIQGVEVIIGSIAGAPAKESPTQEPSVRQRSPHDQAQPYASAAISAMALDCAQGDIGGEQVKDGAAPELEGTEPSDKVRKEAEPRPDQNKDATNKAVTDRSEVQQQASITPYLTWKIRRCGRVRMPFAASLLNSYLSVMGREAFDLDYLKVTPQACAGECAVEPATASQ